MTQLERRETTRARLLDAALECIDELGYRGASTTEIARRAGVSRGAQVHHFPSKAELVTAAIEYTMDRRLAEYSELLERVPPGQHRLLTAIDLLWDVFQTRDCQVFVELGVAARSDDDLRPHLAAFSERHRVAAEEMFRRLLPAAPGEEESVFYVTACKFLLALFDGLVLHTMSGYDDLPGRAEEIVAVAKSLAMMAFPLDAPA